MIDIQTNTQEIDGVLIQLVIPTYEGTPMNDTYSFGEGIPESVIIEIVKTDLIAKGYDVGDI